MAIKGPWGGAVPRRAVLAAIAWAAGLVGAVAIGLALRDRAGGVADAGGLPGVPALLLAVALNLVANAVLVRAWQGIVAVAGAPLRYGVAAWVWASSQLLRYVVGGAQIGSRAVAGRRYRLPAAVGALTAVVEVVWQVAIAGALVLATAPWWLPLGGGYQAIAWLAVAPVALLVAALVNPTGVVGWASRTLRRVPFVRRRLVGAERSRGDPAGGSSARISRRVVAAFTGWQLLNTALRVGALLALLAAVGGDVAADGLQAVGADAVGQFAGRLVVVAPGGLGAREGATGLLIASAVGAAGAVVLVAAARLAEILAELAFLAVARLLRDRGAAPAAGQSAEPAAR